MPSFIAMSTDGISLSNVLKIGGVSIGSLLSKIIDAIASMREPVGASALALTWKETNPCPSVSLFGGRKPMLASRGGNPEIYQQKGNCHL